MQVSRYVAVHVALLAVAAASATGCDGGESEPLSEEATSEVNRQPIETWAFCGVNPNDASAPTAARNLAKAAGITTTMGPCMPPGPLCTELKATPDPSCYSAAFPNQRYISPEDYLRLVEINAAAGMKTIVYDARLWSDSASERQRAYDFWAPHIDSIRAWDMGDEFDPRTPQWDILIHRWNIMVTTTSAATGRGPFTNHLGAPWALDRALQDLGGAENHLSFDLYKFPDAANVAKQFDSRATHLMCAVNALPFHADFIPTAKSIRTDIGTLRTSGCDSILVFGGAPVVDTPEYGTSSLVDADGNATALARAVKTATR